MGLEDLRSRLAPGGLLYDVKGALPIDTVDARL